MVFLVRTTRGLEQFYKHDFNLGLDTGVTAGPVGEGGGPQVVTVDLIAYASSKSLFGGNGLGRRLGRRVE